MIISSPTSSLLVETGSSSTAQVASLSNLASSLMDSKRRFFVDLDESKLPRAPSPDAVPATTGEAVMFSSSATLPTTVANVQGIKPIVRTQSLITASGANLIFNPKHTPLGIGRYSTVMRGSLADKQPVAVKIPNGDEESIEAIRQETRLLGQLTSSTTRILPLLDTVPEMDLSVMPLGVPLDRLHVTKEKFFHWASQLATGLRELHDAGYIHHDIKPHNLLVIEGDLFIADLGQCLQPATWTSTPVSDLSQLELDSDSDVLMQRAPRGTLPIQVGRGRGTAAYTAPELLGQSGLYSNAIDIYSYGVTLYSLLMDREPWKDVSPVKQLIAVRRGYFLDDRYNPVSNSGVHRLSSGELLDEPSMSFLVDLIDRCTQLIPERRPSAAEIERLFIKIP